MVLRRLLEMLCKYRTFVCIVSWFPHLAVRAMITVAFFHYMTEGVANRTEIEIPLMRGTESVFFFSL